MSLTMADDGNSSESGTDKPQAQHCDKHVAVWLEQLPFRHRRVAARQTCHCHAETESAEITRTLSVVRDQFDTSLHQSAKQALESNLVLTPACTRSA